MTFDVRADQTSQLQLSNIHGADDLEVRRTIEPRYSTPEAREFLQRHTMTISIKNADVDELKANRHGSHVRSMSPRGRPFDRNSALVAAGPRSLARQAGPTEIRNCTRR